MLADGEILILPALLLILGLYPVSIWTLVRSLQGARGALLAWSGAIITTIAGVGLVTVLKNLEWPPGKIVCISILFWSFPLFSGVVTLLRMKRAKPE